MTKNNTPLPRFHLFFSLVVLGSLCLISAFQAPRAITNPRNCHYHLLQKQQRPLTALCLSTVAPPAPEVPSSTNDNVQLISEELSMALKKPSKTLTVGMEYCCGATNKESSNKNNQESELDTLSMQLRKLQVNTIWTSDIKAATQIAKEQATAKGNFPGPCPIVFYPDDNTFLQLSDPVGEDALKKSGVSAVAIKAKDVADSNHLITRLSAQEFGIIFQVESIDDVQNILRLYKDHRLAFLVKSTTTSDDINNDATLLQILSELTTRKDAIVIVSMPSMQGDNAEISRGRALRLQGGVHGVVLEQAIVGDPEDVEYCSFAVTGLTQKKSSTFNMSGLTGSTNGHFGGVGTSVARTWKRVVYGGDKK